MGLIRKVKDDGERGFVIVAVLCAIVALATLASVYSIYVSNTAAASRISEDRIRASALAVAGVEVAAYRLTSARVSERPGSGSFSLRIRSATVAVRFVSENSRIDLNAAPKALLSGLFESVGGDPTLAPYYADRVIGWRQIGDVAGQNDELSRYRAAGVPYAPRQGPFPSAMELSLVLGLPEQTVRQALPFVTVFSGRAEIDAVNAAPEVIAALPGMSPEKVKSFLDQRDAEPDNVPALLARLGGVQSFATSDRSKAMRIFVNADLGDGRGCRVEAVILPTENDDDPYRTLYWNEQMDNSR
jgi:general secretion pathway protein K